jgi:hypothetical protein
MKPQSQQGLVPLGRGIEAGERRVTVKLMFGTAARSQDVKFSPRATRKEDATRIRRESERKPIPVRGGRSQSVTRSVVTSSCRWLGYGLIDKTMTDEGSWKRMRKRDTCCCIQIFPRLRVFLVHSCQQR